MPAYFLAAADRSRLDQSRVLIDETYRAALSREARNQPADCAARM